MTPGADWLNSVAMRQDAGKIREEQALGLDECSGPGGNSTDAEEWNRRSQEGEEAMGWLRDPEVGMDPLTLQKYLIFSFFQGPKIPQFPVNELRSKIHAGDPLAAED